MKVKTNLRAGSGGTNSGGVNSGGVNSNKSTSTDSTTEVQTPDSTVVYYAPVLTARCVGY
jgi:hypothetical protein